MLVVFGAPNGIIIMALGLEAKKAIVSEVKDVAENALSAVVADYRGVVVEDLTKLRAAGRQNGVYIRVVRNTLARRALSGTEFECMNQVLTGPTILAFAQEDPGAPARLFKDFAKAHDHFEITALATGGELFGAEQIDKLANLPTREQALSMLLSVMKAPVSKLATTLNEIPAKLVRTLLAIQQEKEKA